MQKEQTSIPTVYLEIIMITSLIDFKEDRDIETIDIFNLFIQTLTYSKYGEDKIIIRIKGVMVDMLVHMNP